MKEYIEYLMAKEKTAKKANDWLPIKILHSNDRVAEVQYICDNCGKQLRTSLVPNTELNKPNKLIICWNCKQTSKPQSTF